MIIRIPLIGRYELKRYVPKNYDDDPFKRTKEYLVLRDAIRHYFHDKLPQTVYQHYIHACGLSHYTSRKQTRAIYRLLKHCPQRIQAKPREKRRVTNEL